MLVPRVLALLTRLVAKVRWPLPWGLASGSHGPANPPSPSPHAYS